MSLHSVSRPWRTGSYQHLLNQAWCLPSPRPLAFPTPQRTSSSCDHAVTLSEFDGNIFDQYTSLSCPGETKTTRSIQKGGKQGPWALIRGKTLVCPGHLRNANHIMEVSRPTEYVSTKQIIRRNKFRCAQWAICIVLRVKCTFCLGRPWVLLLYESQGASDSRSTQKRLLKTGPLITWNLIS